MNEKLLTTINIVLLISLGIAGTLTYQNFKNERTLNGLYINNNISYETANQIANVRDKKGDWVCINVAYDMPVEEAYNTCVHECSHKSFSEIFAEKCEDNETKCLEYLK
jgi:hypothetical protein